MKFICLQARALKIGFHEKNIFQKLKLEIQIQLSFLETSGLSVY